MLKRVVWVTWNIFEIFQKQKLKKQNKNKTTFFQKKSFKFPLLDVLARTFLECHFKSRSFPCTVETDGLQRGNLIGFTLIVRVYHLEVDTQMIKEASKGMLLFICNLKENWCLLIMCHYQSVRIKVRPTHTSIPDTHLATLYHPSPKQQCTHSPPSLHCLLLPLPCCHRATTPFAPTRAVCTVCSPASAAECWEIDEESPGAWQGNQSPLSESECGYLRVASSSGMPSR